MSSAVPDPRIAAYIAEISVPGIPYVSTSHVTLHRLHREHGEQLIQSLINDYFKEARCASTTPTK